MPASAAAWFSRASSVQRICTSPIVNLTVAEDIARAGGGQRNRVNPRVLSASKIIDLRWASTSSRGGPGSRRRAPHGSLHRFPHPHRAGALLLGASALG